MIWRCDLVPQYEAYKAEIDEAMARVLRSGVYILGKEVTEFEKEFARYVGTTHSVGVANATDALTLSLMALGVGVGDEVITSPFTAIPTVSAIVDSGATPVFVDICPDTFLMNLDLVAKAITPKTKAIMPVHIFGNVLDVPSLRKITGRIPIIEDASQSHGATLSGVQSGSFGDVGVFSFYPTKNLGAYGDGGAIVTSSAELAQKLKQLRMYGMIDKDTIVAHGVNSRLDELQAAVLRVKLGHLDDMNCDRNRIADRYRNELRADLFEFQRIPQGIVSNWHVFVARFKANRERFMAWMDEAKIQTNIYYKIPLHLQKANAYLGIGEGLLPETERLCQSAVALPLYPELDDRTLDVIIKRANAFPDAAR